MDTQLPTGTVVIWTDLVCPWGSLAVHRLREARSRSGLDEVVRIDHRAFPLELINERGTSRRTLAAEVAVLGSHVPDLGWQVWKAPEAHWPSTVLLALEAVQAAKDPAIGGLRASEDLDAALRHAFFAESRNIGLWSVVIDVARRCESLDAGGLEAALSRGVGRADVVAHWRGFAEAGVKGSPHLFLPDGSDFTNPGIKMHWTVEYGEGFPVLDADDPGVYDDIMERVAAQTTRGAAQ